MENLEINLTPGQHRYYGKITDDLRRVKSEISSIYNTARVFYSSAESVRNQIADRVWNMKQYKRLPEKFRNEVKGYYDGVDSMFQFAYIEWALWYDGKFIGHSHRNKEATDAMYKRADFDNSKVKGHHVYKETEIIFF